MSIEWPRTRKGKPQYIERVDRSLKLLVPNRNYVLLRRFSAKEEARRLTAAPYIGGTVPGPMLGFENHLNFIYPRFGELTLDEAWGLAALLNSRLFDTYFRAINGNTQVSATELRVMRMPDLEVITEIGRRVRDVIDPCADLDAIVETVLPDAPVPVGAPCE